MLIIKKKGWQLAKDWVYNNCTGHKQKKARVFNQYQLQKFKDYSDPNHFLV